MRERINGRGESWSRIGAALVAWIVPALVLAGAAGVRAQSHDGHQGHSERSGGAGQTAPEHAGHAGHAPPPAPADDGVQQLGSIRVPDIVLKDQDGRDVRFYSDLIQGKRVVINTIFTTCTTICPPMGATYSKLQSLLEERGERDVHLISISVDPVRDTPERLKAWGEKFHAGPGWTLVTGPKLEVDRVLKGLEVFTANPEDHSPVVLVGDEPRGEWTRAYGLVAPSKLLELVDSIGGAAAAPAATPGEDDRNREAARAYFTDVVLLSQRGEEKRLYSDLLAGHTVVIHPFFTTCKAACPATMAKLQKIQAWLGDRLGSEVNILSMTVDPQTDTVEVIEDYAAKLGPRPGWYFLTGQPEAVSFALKRLGQHVDDPELHTSLLLVGNVDTGLWKKAFAYAETDELIRIVDSVLSDEG